MRIRRRLDATGLHVKATDYVGQASRRYRTLRSSDHVCELPTSTTIDDVPGVTTRTLTKRGCDFLA